QTEVVGLTVFGHAAEIALHDVEVNDQGGCVEFGYEHVRQKYSNSQFYRKRRVNFPSGVLYHNSRSFCFCFSMGKYSSPDTGASVFFSGRISSFSAFMSGESPLAALDIFACASVICVGPPPTPPP